MTRHPFRTRLAVFVIGAALLAAACGGGTSEQGANKRKPTKSTTTTTRRVEIAPFTGLPDPDGVANDRSSLAVKIENSPDARPQSGLDVADIVYEEVVEGGITRFWAVFNSQAPENVGPVRSVRAMDPSIVWPLGGVIAFSGGTGPNVAAVRATGLLWVDESNAGDNFFRDSSRSAPHNLIGRTELLSERGGTPVPPAPMFSYVEEGEAFTGEPVSTFTINFQQGYDVTYVWDDEESGWKRFQPANEPFMAVGSTPFPNQVIPQNVIVQFAPYVKGSEADLIGEGDAWIFSNGQLIRGRWDKFYPGAPTNFTDASGQPIRLTPGRTWVELFPTGGTVDVVAGVAPVTTTSKPAASQDGKKKTKKDNT